MLGTREALSQKARTFLSVGIRGPDAWVRPADQKKTTRESRLARPTSDPFLADHELARPVIFSSPLDPTRTDPTREIRETVDPTRDIRKTLDPT